MTIALDGTKALAEALRILANDIEAGHVATCSVHYEHTGVTRLSATYVTGEESDLPGLPGVTVVDDEDDITEVTKPC